jgi:hypothetical protein
MFPLASVFRSALRPTQPHIQWVPGTFPVGKARQGRDADHSLPSSAEVKNEQELASPSWCLQSIAGQLNFALRLLFSWNNVIAICFQTESLVPSGL